MEWAVTVLHFCLWDKRWIGKMRITTNKNQLRKKPFILLVEDDALTRKLHVALLEKLNCEVVVAVNGEEAVKKFNTHFDLIIVDIHLPGISGIEVCQRIQLCHKTKFIPIVALTACGEEVEEDCRRAGIAKVYTKPLTLHGFYQLLQRWVGPLCCIESAEFFKKTK